MSECKVKISVDICGESALDKVSTLVAAQSGDMSPLSVRDICKQVADEFNTTNEGAHVKWETLRKAYTRAQKVGTCPQSNTKKVATCSNSEKELVPLDVPMVDSSTIILEEKEKYEQRIQSLQDTITTLLPFVDRVVELEEELKLYKKDVIVPAAVEKMEGIISRQRLNEFVLTYGKEIQTAAIKRKDSLPNKEAFGLFSVVREQYKASTPPGAWDPIIINAIKIEN